MFCRPQWPRGLRRGSAVLRARIPPGEDIFSLGCVVYCHVEVSGTGRSLVKRSPLSVVRMSVIVKPR